MVGNVTVDDIIKKKGELSFCNKLNTHLRKLKKKKKVGLFYTEISPDVGDEVLEVFPEFDAADPVQGQGHVSRQSVEGCEKPLSGGRIGLTVYKLLH